jgi:hypothetical protein
VPLCFHPHVGVAREHGARDVAGNGRDHLIARTRLSELCCQSVAVVVPSTLRDILQGRYWLRSERRQNPEGVRGACSRLFRDWRDTAISEANSRLVAKWRVCPRGLNSERPNRHFAVDRELSAIEPALLSRQSRCPRQHKGTHQPFGRE